MTSQYLVLALLLQQCRPKAGTAVVTERWQLCSPLWDLTMGFSSCNNSNWRAHYKCAGVWSIIWSIIILTDENQWLKWLEWIEDFLTLYGLCTNRLGKCCPLKLLWMTPVLEKERKREESSLANWQKEYILQLGWHLVAASSGGRFDSPNANRVVFI